MATWSVRQANAGDIDRIVEMFNMVRDAGFFRPQIAAWTRQHAINVAQGKVVGVCEVSNLNAFPGVTMIVAFSAFPDPDQVQGAVRRSVLVTPTPPTYEQRVYFNMGSAAVAGWDTRLPTADHVRRAVGMCFRAASQYYKARGITHIVFTEPVVNGVRKCVRPDWVSFFSRTLLGASPGGSGEEVYAVEYEVQNVETTTLAIEAEPDPG